MKSTVFFCFSKYNRRFYKYSDLILKLVNDMYKYWKNYLEIWIQYPSKE